MTQSQFFPPSKLAFLNPLGWQEKRTGGEYKKLGPWRRALGLAFPGLHPGFGGQGVIETSCRFEGPGAEGVYSYCQMESEWWSASPIYPAPGKKQEHECKWLGRVSALTGLPHRIPLCSQAEKEDAPKKIAPRVGWKKQRETQRPEMQMRLQHSCGPRRGNACLSQCQPSRCPFPNLWRDISLLKLRPNLTEKGDLWTEIKFLAPDRMKAKVWVQLKQNKENVCVLHKWVYVLSFVFLQCRLLVCGAF